MVQDKRHRWHGEGLPLKAREADGDEDWPGDWQVPVHQLQRPLPPRQPLRDSCDCGDVEGARRMLKIVCHSRSHRRSSCTRTVYHRQAWKGMRVRVEALDLTKTMPLRGRISDDRTGYIHLDRRMRLRRRHSRHSRHHHHLLHHHRRCQQHHRHLHQPPSSIGLHEHCIGSRCNKDPCRLGRALRRRLASSLWRNLGMGCLA